MSLFKKRKISPAERLMAHELQGKRDQLFDAERRSAQVQSQLISGLAGTLKREKVKNIWRNTLLMVKPNSWLSLIALFMIAGLVVGIVFSEHGLHLIGRKILSDQATATDSAKRSEPVIPKDISITVPVVPEVTISSVPTTLEEVQLRLSYTLSQPTN